MSFNKKDKKTQEKDNESDEIEIVMGGENDLEISSVGDYMNDLKPKTEQHKKIVIPKAKGTKK